MGSTGSAPRSRVQTLKAVLVASSAVARFHDSAVLRNQAALRKTAKVLGAKPVASLWLGLTAGEVHHKLSAGVLARARHIGMKLV